jgi:polysaccharide deacetylase 2 family uncharacterized protein YibQ
MTTANYISPSKANSGRVKATLFIAFLYWWTMPAISMPDDINVTSKTNTSKSSANTILDADFLSKFNNKAPAPEPSADSMIKHSITFDDNIESFGTSRGLREDTDTSKELGEPIIVADVAIIIDDIGYNRNQGLAAINIPGNLTYAIIPHSPYAKFLATTAHQQRKEVILHAPMSNIHNHPLGKSGLTEDMGEAVFDSTLLDALASVPHISGVNNHMGSLLTQMQRPMEWTMKTLKANGLFFIDSRTTPASVAWKTAQKYNIASLKRDVFLDHQRDSIFIAEQFERFISIAKRNGYAIAIAHPYPETTKYLIDNIHRLEAHGIRLRSASELVNHYSPNKQQQAKM